MKDAFAIWLDLASWMTDTDKRAALFKVRRPYACPCRSCKCYTMRFADISISPHLYEITDRETSFKLFLTSRFLHDYTLTSRQDYHGSFRGRHNVMFKVHCTVGNVTQVYAKCVCVHVTKKNSIFIFFKII